MPRQPPYRPQPFNPLDKTNLGESVADALLERPIDALPPDERFIGAGIYAIYYLGNFDLYSIVAEENRNCRCAWPIYVGKAVPKGARRGGLGLGADPGEVLSKRLSEHARSIDKANNLNLGDFRCRFLVVDDIWIPLAESLLIEIYFPLWNRVIDGFGIHAPGSGRGNQRRSLWDTIHPGRPWAENLQPSDKTEAAIRKEALEFINLARENIGRLPDCRGNP